MMHIGQRSFRSGAYESPCIFYTEIPDTMAHICAALNSQWFNDSLQNPSPNQNRQLAPPRY